jgi:hypothetical protein
MIEVTIQIEGDAHYPTKLHTLPSVGDYLEVNSYSDLEAGYDNIHNLKVKSIKHHIIEFPDAHKTIKKHSQNVVVTCVRAS